MAPLATDAIDIHPVTDRCWDEERPGLINGSEIGSLFGVGYKTLARITAEKRDPSTFSDSDPESPLLERGNDFQEAATKRVQKLRPTWHISRNTNHYVDRKHRMAAIPDNLVEAPDRHGIGVLEIKVVASSIFKTQWPDDTPPMKHLLQLSQQMMLVPGCTWGAIGALVIGEFKYETHVYEVDRNEKAETRLRGAVAEFWQTFDRGDLPAIDFERDGDLIALMYPTATPGKVIDLTFDNAIRELLEQRESLRAGADEVEKLLKTCENEIKAKLADAEMARVNGWRVTFKSQHRKAHEVKASSFRVLRATRDEKHQQERAT
jgi:predicted phage-related endonuclease